MFQACFMTFNDFMISNNYFFSSLPLRKYQPLEANKLRRIAMNGWELTTAGKIKGGTDVPPQLVIRAGPYRGPPRLLQFWYRSLWHRNMEINYQYSYNISHFLRPWRGMKLFHRQRCIFCSVWMRKRRYRRKKFRYKRIDEPSKSAVYCLTIIIYTLT